MSSETEGEDEAEPCEGEEAVGLEAMLSQVCMLGLGPGIACVGTHTVPVVSHQRFCFQVAGGWMEVL